MDSLPKYPYLRDGIDVYVGDDSTVTFVFLATRRRLKLKCHAALVESLRWMRGRKTLEEIREVLQQAFPEVDLAENAFEHFLLYLSSKNIVVDKHWQKTLGLPKRYQRRLERQLHFLMDLVEDSARVAAIQKRILATKVAVFGVGGVGGWLVRELAMMGFMNFVLVDPSTTRSSDAARHAFFDETQVGEPKVDCVAHGLLSIDADMKVQTHILALDIDTNLETLLGEVGLIINAADEPYIGYTSIKLSRYALSQNVPLFVAGGFDAHLASFGEPIIPRVTPCADCYSDYFKESLKDWKPAPHPVTNRSMGFGGWSALSVVSASVGAAQVLKFLIDPSLLQTGRRTELLSTDYSTYSLEIARNANCRICSNR